MSTDEIFSKAPRPTGDFLKTEIYPLQFDTHIRFQDLDPLGHVNNVALAAIFEDIRVRASDKMKLKRFQKSARVVGGGVELAYLREVFRKSPLSFYFGIGYIGNTSWREHALGVQDGMVAFAGSATLVYKDSGGAKKLTPELIEALETFRLAPSGSAAAKRTVF